MAVLIPIKYQNIVYLLVHFPFYGLAIYFRNTAMQAYRSVIKQKSNFASNTAFQNSIGIKKIKASTLMETLVATILLIIIFMVASLTVSNLFGNTVAYNTQSVATHLNELEYRYQNRQLPLPYAGVYDNWNVAVSTHLQHNTACVTLEATHTQTQKTISKTIIAHAENP